MHRIRVTFRVKGASYYNFFQSKNMCKRDRRDKLWCTNKLNGMNIADLPPSKKPIILTKPKPTQESVVGSDRFFSDTVHQTHQARKPNRNRTSQKWNRTNHRPNQTPRNKNQENRETQRVQWIVSQSEARIVRYIQWNLLKFSNQTYESASNWLTSHVLITKRAR